METSRFDTRFAVKRGTLTDDELASGLHCCYCNAQDLFEDAKILLKNERPARAFGLCVLCLEELAKIPLLCNGVLLKGKDASVWKKFWNALAAHALKQNVWSVYGGVFLPESRRKKYYSRRYPRGLPSLEKMKQLSFYVDFFEKGPARPTMLFQSQRKVIDFVFRMAADRLEAFRPLHCTLERSRRAVRLMSLIKFEGLSDAELVEKLFSSMDFIKATSASQAVR